MFEKTIEKEYDVVVVGAGFAGVCAAVAAARNGAATALVTDRPVLGGNGSSEIRVPPRGAATPDRNLWGKETGLIEEITLRIFQLSGAREYRWSQIDRVLFDIVMEEPLLTLYLNTLIDTADMVKDGSRIASVSGNELRAERRLTCKSGIFIDASGDGSLGALAGAEWRYGREAREEFNERLAPDMPDDGIMGPTLLFKTKHRGYPVKFTAPSWAIDITEIPNLVNPERTVGRDYYRRRGDIFYGLWWAEVCRPELHQIYDSGDISLEGRKLVLGLWDYIKNSGKFAGVEDQELDWIAALPGKRESRRLVGPYILSMNDLMDQVEFDDKIGYAGWAIDIHAPQGYLDDAPSTTSFCRDNDLPGLTDIPLRSLYSRNVDNLFFAGRNVSCSHFALGSLRVQGTTSVMGQAVGTAAAFCVSEKVMPGDLTAQMTNRIQHRLVRDDQSILNFTLLEEDDLSLSAEVSASSERPMSVTEADCWIDLNQVRGLVVPVVTDKLDTISFLADGDGELTCEIFSTGKPVNYRLEKCLKKTKIRVSGQEWINVDVNLTPGCGNKLFFVFRSNGGVKLAAGMTKMVGVAGVTFKDNASSGIDSVFTCDEHIYCFKTVPEQNVYSPEALKDGYIRPEGAPHLYSSAEEQAAELSFAWSEPVDISSIELVFDSNLNEERLKNYYKYDELVKDFSITAYDNNGVVINRIEVKNNTRRLVKCELTSPAASQLKIQVTATWGHPNVNIFDVRIY